MSLIVGSGPRICLPQFTRSDSNTSFFLICLDSLGSLRDRALIYRQWALELQVLGLHNRMKTYSLVSKYSRSLSLSLINLQSSNRAGSFFLTRKTELHTGAQEGIKQSQKPKLLIYISVPKNKNQQRFFPTLLWPSCVQSSGIPFSKTCKHSSKKICTHFGYQAPGL